MIMERFASRKLPIAEIEEGEQGENIVATRYGGVGRARVLGTVVKKFIGEKYAFVVIDDTTSSIRAKVFDPSVLSSINEGAIVDVTGRIREFNGERYLAIDTIRELNDPNWITLRLLEMAEEMRNSKKVKELMTKGGAEEQARVIGISREALEGFTEGRAVLEDKARVLDVINTLDSGSGASYQAIIEKSGLSEANIEIIINVLLSDGICYEPKPGFIKKL